MIKHKKYNLIKEIIKQHHNLWLYGDASSGKSFTIKQIADELGLNYISYNCGSQTSIEDLCGYKTITGTEISGVFNQAVGKPCIIVLEEIDLLNNKIQNQLNSLLEERVINIQEQPIALHEDTIIVGTANTDGMNYSDTYMTRQQSDQSLLSRFVRIKYDIDPAIEFWQSGNNQVVQDFMVELRKADKENVLNATTRLTKSIAKLMKIATTRLISKELLEVHKEFGELVKNNDRLMSKWTAFLKIPFIKTPDWPKDQEPLDIPKEIEKPSDKENKDKDTKNVNPNKKKSWMEDDESQDAVDKLKEATKNGIKTWNGDDEDENLF